MSIYSLSGAIGYSDATGTNISPIDTTIQLGEINSGGYDTIPMYARLRGLILELTNVAGASSITWSLKDALGARFTYDVTSTLVLDGTNGYVYYQFNDSFVYFQTSLRHIVDSLVAKLDAGTATLNGVTLLFEA